MAPPPQQQMVPTPQASMMMGQPQMPPANSYVPVNHSSSGPMVPTNHQNSVHAPLGPGGQQPGAPQYPVNRPPIQHSAAGHMKLNSQSQPVHVDPQNPHTMMMPGGGGGGGGPIEPPHPHMMGPPPPPQSSRGDPTNPHGMGPPTGGPQPGSMMQHPSVVRPMMPPSSSPLSSPSSSSEHSIIQHGSQPMPSAPSATSTPQPEEKEEVAELISFD